MRYRVAFKNLIFPSLLSVFLLGCIKDKDTYPEEYYIKAQLNNKPLSIVVKKEHDSVVCNKFNYGTRLPNANFTYFYVHVAAGTMLSNTNTNFAIRFYLIKHFPENYSETDMVAMFKVGKYDFGKHFQNSDSTKEGGIVTVTDQNHNEWYSDLANNSNPSNYFEVIEIRDSKRQKEQYWKLRVNCNLQDKSGNVMRLENAEVKGFIQAL